ncbi:MAG: DUF3078 domain-containing protein [Sphingobacteriaceae bacterium]|nr:DUF3078 domain-containing protein [Sphingobacteriaceae bacterium]
MKKVLIFICLNCLCFALQAQNKDSLNIDLRRFKLNLKHNPLPIRTGFLTYKPVMNTPIILSGRVNYWRHQSNILFDINQAAFTNNWKAGGVNSLAFGAKIHHKSEYNYLHYNYVSELILQYGKMQNKNQLTKKTVDRIYFDNKAAIQLSRRWYFFGSINFESQFSNGYTYSDLSKGPEKETLISRFMSPGYLTESFGFEHKTTPYFLTRIGTGTARQTFVLDTTIYKTNEKNFGVPRGKRFRNDLAFQVVSNFDKEIAKNMVLKAKYSMFIPYQELDQIDHRLDVNLVAKVNKHIHVSITGVVFYDENTDKKIQASQMLALGLSFSIAR